MYKRFFMLYSMGKDSTLALQKMLSMGYEPVALVIGCNRKTNETMQHHIPIKKLKRFSDSLNIPIELVYLKQNDDWASVMRAGIRLREKYDAEFLVTGDIDVQEHIDRTKKFAELTGLTLMLPLWGMTREACLKEEMESGYTCLISTLVDIRLPTSLLGQKLTQGAIEIITRYGCDACGEDGSYHTLIVDSPLHRFPIKYRLEDILVNELVREQTFEIE